MKKSLAEKIVPKNNKSRLGVVQTGLLIFHAVAELRNSGKSPKSHEIHKNTQNTAKFGRNLIKYMSVQHI